MAYMNNGVGVLTMSMGVGTSVPFSVMPFDGTKVPAPGEKIKEVGVLTPLDINGFEVSTLFSMLKYKK